MLELVKTRLPKAYGYSPMEDIQVITPSRKGVMGVIELNQRLQAVLNPPSPSLPEVKSMLYTFREGDKVMQIKNNYDIIWHKDGENGTGIFNGDIGYLRAINRQTQEVVAEFDGRRATYPFEQLDQLELAYAVTVHKSQGSEFQAVVMPLLGGFPKLYYRNLLYTAVTRARRLLIMIGSQKSHLSDGGKQPPYESIYLSAGYAGTAKKHCADTAPGTAGSVRRNRTGRTRTGGIVMSKTDIGIDLGTANTVITLGKKGRCTQRTLCDRLSHPHQGSPGCGQACLSDDRQDPGLY